MNYLEEMRNVFFSGQHLIVNQKRPHRSLRHLRQSLKMIEGYIDFGGCYGEGHDFFASAKLRAKNVGYPTVFIEFCGGIFVIGKLKDKSNLFKHKSIIYAAYFGSDAKDNQMQMIAIPKDQEFVIGIGRETSRFYVAMCSKKPWERIDFANNACYRCKATKIATAHPDIIRIPGKKQLPTISFTESTRLDELQQLHLANENDTHDRRFVFVRGELRLL